MANGEGTKAADRDLIFNPAIRKLLNRLISLQRDSLEYSRDGFTGFVKFKIPTADGFQPTDILTVCAERAQKGLGGRAMVETWLICRPDAESVELRPAEYELQEEDLEQVPPVSRREFMDMVEPSEGWNG